MPHSGLRSTAAERASYTREVATAAAHGVTRDLAFGLDACPPRQQQLRAVLALAIFNCGRRSAWPRQTPLHELSIYTFAISPRRDELVIITEAPHNIVGRLVPRDRLPEWGLPGLRVKRESGNGAELVHLPTGARMTVTRDRAGRLDNDATPPTRLWRDDHPLTKEECTVLKSLPAMSAQAQTLLGALTTRMSTKDPSGSWDIAMWFTDPSTAPASEVTGTPGACGAKATDGSWSGPPTRTRKTCWPPSQRPAWAYRAPPPSVYVPGGISAFGTLSSRCGRESLPRWTVQHPLEPTSSPCCIPEAMGDPWGRSGARPPAPRDSSGTSIAQATDSTRMRDITPCSAF